MIRRAIVILGTGGHASVVIDAAICAGFDVAGCVGPDSPAFDAEYCRYLGTDDVLATLDASATDLAIGVGSIGRPQLRQQLYEQARERGFNVPTIVHPAATVAGSARLAEGVQVMAGAIVQAWAEIGANVLINTGALVEHHARVGAHTHVAPRAVLCGDVMVESECHIGANATVLQGRSVGDRAVIGGGAVVVRDVSPGRIVKGVPAR